jgi:hypothetical protein
MTVCAEGIWQIFEDRWPIDIFTGPSFWSPAKFERCDPSDIKIKVTRVSPSLSFALASISTVLCSSISVYLCLTPPVHSVHLSLETFCWCIVVKAILRGVNGMLGVGWVPHQPSHALDNVSTPVFDRPLVIVVPSHILEGVEFPFPERLIISHASHELLDSIHVFEAWERQSGVFFLQHGVIVRLYTMRFDHSLDIFVLFTHRKQVIGIVM